MSEWDIGKNFTVVQGVGPTYNILGYGTDIEFDSEIIDLYEQFTYLGGLRFYPGQKDHEKFASRGFSGTYMAIHYAVNFDALVKPGDYKWRPPFQFFVDEMNCVGLLVGYQTNVGKRFYANVNVGAGLNTFLYDRSGPLASFDCGWRFLERSFRN